MTSPADEFASLPLARAYVDTVREEVGSLEPHELIDALERLDRAYHQFPELALDRPREELLEALQSAARNMRDRTAIPLLMYCIASGPARSSSLTLLVEKLGRSDDWPSLSRILRMLARSREVRWDAIKPVLDVLRQQGRADGILPVISELLGSLTFTSEQSASEFGDILTCFLGGEPRAGGEAGALAETLRCARRRLTRPVIGGNVRGSAAAHLAMAERLRPALSATRPDLRPELGWPSGRLSFDEFLLQWPCEIELAAELDDTAFIEEAYRAILLRGPDADERAQYLRLLEDGAIARPWIIEDLLASAECRSLDRRLRVVWDGQVITEPGSLGEEDMPAVTWPSRSAS